MATNLVFHAHMKHIKLDYHFVRERVEMGTHKVQFIPFVNQPANVLTKRFSKPRFAFLRSKLIAP